MSSSNMKSLLGSSQLMWYKKMKGKKSFRNHELFFFYNMMYIKIDFFKNSPSYDQFIININCWY